MTDLGLSAFTLLSFSLCFFVVCIKVYYLDVVNCTIYVVRLWCCSFLFYVLSAHLCEFSSGQVRIMIAACAPNHLMLLF